MESGHRHALTNLIQTVLLIGVLVGIGALAGSLLFGETGMWFALAACVVALLIQPGTAQWLTLRLYRAQPIAPTSAPALWEAVAEVAERAGLPACPALYYVPSPIVNAFAVGGRQRSAIALTDGLLRTLSVREITAVMAHEVAHIAHGDLRVMGLADYVSRLTGMFALFGQVFVLVSLPLVFAGELSVNWLGLAVLVLSPHIALLAQLGLSRVREFDADLSGASLTGDPDGLASALAHIERASRSWRSILLPGWGNPEPSWLRTHPATEERIERLLALRTIRSVRSPFSDAAQGRSWSGRRHAPPARTGPRWHVGGHWW